MKKRLILLALEVVLAAGLMWLDMRAFWLYFFAIALWNASRLFAVLAANKLELRIHLETIQNRVGVLPTDATVIVQNMKENMSQEEWENLSEVFDFAKR